MTPGTAFRELQRAQSILRKSRQALVTVRGDEVSPELRARVFVRGWEALAQMHQILALIPAGAANEEILTKQLAVERYGTSLLVRLRRLQRNEMTGDDAEIDMIDES